MQENQENIEKVQSPELTDLEVELEELKAKVEKQRAELEAANSIVVDRAIVADIVEKDIVEPAMESVPNQNLEEEEGGGELSSEQRIKLHEVTMLFEAEGIDKAVRAAKEQDFAVMAEFCRLLKRDLLYEKLKEQGVVT